MRRKDSAGNDFEQGSCRLRRLSGINCGEEWNPVPLRTPFAWRNVTHRKIRSFVALAGVSGSVLLIFMQLGFYFAVLDSVTGVLRSIKADIFLISPHYVLLGRTGTIPRERLYQARGVEGVR